MKQLFNLALVGGLFLSACSDPAMEKRLADLETKVAELEKRPAGPAGAAGAADPNDPKEKEAAELLRKAGEASEKGNYDEAKTVLADLKAKFGETRAAKAAARLEQEIGLIGSAAPTLASEKFFQGETDFTKGKATLVVFWEVWCPHCKREVPKLEATFNKFKGNGLNVVGLTKQTRDTTDDQVKEFISSNNISYPIAKEKGDEMSQAFGVRGVPAAAAVKDGKIIWRGHPARVTDELIQSWIGG